MKVLIEPTKTGDTLATIAVGEKYYRPWHTYAFPTWKLYCERHGFGLVAFDEDQIATDHPTWKKATWQKLLIPASLKQAGYPARNVCYVDTDILINPFAPSIFADWNPERIGLTSLRTNLPFPLADVQRRLAFLRHTHYDSSYPLDSALFMSIEQLYEHHGLAVQPDEACMGLIVFNVERHGDVMLNWFNKYDRNVQSVTGGGDQTHVNFEIQSSGLVQWLDYRFQAMWAYEMAWKYPFLYSSRRHDDELARECVEASLYQNYFLHFAGSWHEGDLWKKGIIFAGEVGEELKRYNEYLATPVTGEPKGQIKPRAPA